MKFKKNCLILSIVCFVVCIFAIAYATTIKDDMTFEGPVTITGAFTPSAMGTVTFTNGLTIDNGTNNVFEWNENSEEVTWTFGTNALDLDSTSGVVTLGIFDGSAGTINHTADGAADDFTVSVTGAFDSSLVLSSSGTAADAMQITATAGGIDISASGAATGEDIDITASGSSVNVVATEAAADQFKVDAQGAIAGDAINLETTDGGIMLNADGAANGDIEINSADDTALVSAGDMTLTSTGTVAIDSSDWDISTTGAVTGIASITFDNGSGLYEATVTITAAEVKALRATPKEIIAATASSIAEFVSAVFVLDYGSEVFAETADNLVIEYEDGVDITAAIETTGFIDQAADQVAIINAADVPTITAAAAVNKGIQLFNTGDGEITGNASDDSVLTLKVTYRLHTVSL